MQKLSKIGVIYCPPFPIGNTQGDSLTCPTSCGKQAEEPEATLSALNQLFPNDIIAFIAFEFAFS